LLFVAIAKKLLSQPAPVNDVIDRGTVLVTDPPPGFKDTLGELNVLGYTRPARTKFLIENTDFRKQLPAHRHIGAGESLNLFKAQWIFNEVYCSELPLSTDEIFIMFDLRRHKDRALHDIEGFVLEEISRHIQPFGSDNDIIVKESDNLAACQFDGRVLGATLACEGLFDHAKLGASGVAEDLDDLLDFFRDFIVSRVIRHNHFVFDACRIKMLTNGAQQTAKQFPTVISSDDNAKIHGPALFQTPHRSR